MIVNLRPENLGLLDCVVEECDERFTAEQQAEIVHIIGDVLGGDGEGGGSVEEVVNGDGSSGVNGERVNGNGMNGVHGDGAREDDSM